MSIVMSEDHATQDLTPWLRNMHTPRTSQSPAQYAQWLHAEELEHHARWPERVMLFLAGVFVGGVLLSQILPK